MISPDDLLNFFLFSSLTLEDVKPLAPYLQSRRFRRGQILFVEGEIGSNVYFVLSGQIKLSKTSLDGTEHIVDWCGKYDSIADVLLLESGPYPATAECILESNVLILSNQGMSKIIQHNPNLAIALIRTLSKRLRLSQEFIRVLTSRSTAGVLANLLLRLAKAPDNPGESIYIEGSLTHKDLADMIGTSRECVNRSLNLWKRSGILKQADGRIELLKPQELADWP